MGFRKVFYYETIFVVLSILLFSILFFRYYFDTSFQQVSLRDL